MKRTRVQRFIGVDATSAGELAELLNEKIEQIHGAQPEIKWFDNRFSALLFYTEHVEEPENIRDEYELRGECYTCGDCPMKWPVTDGRSRHRWACKRCPGGTDEDIRACVRFYQMLEDGEVFK